MDNVEMIKILDDVEIPIDFAVSNIIENTQPSGILKYKYLYGSFNDSNSWMKIFKLDMGFHSLMFNHTSFDNLTTKNVVKIGNKKTNKFKVFLPNLIFVVHKSKDFVIKLEVYATNNTSDRDNMQLYSAPLPNLYENGAVCQSNKISISKTFIEIKSLISKNIYEICEYYIDIFLDSTFNSDLDVFWSTAVSKMGFVSPYEFMKTATAVENVDKMISIYQSMENNSNSMKYFNDNIKSFKNKINLHTFHKYCIDDCVVDNFNYQQQLNLSKYYMISVGDYIKYKGEVVKIISFGSDISNISLYMNLGSENYTKYHNLKYMTETYEIGLINFSDFENIEQCENVTISQDDYSLYNIDEDTYINLGSYAYKIQKIEYQKINDVYIFSFMTHSDEIIRTNKISLNYFRQIPFDINFNNFTKITLMKNSEMTTQVQIVGETYTWKELNEMIIQAYMNDSYYLNINGRIEGYHKKNFVCVEDMKKQYVIGERMIIIDNHNIIMNIDTVIKYSRSNNYYYCDNDLFKNKLHYDDSEVIDPEENYTKPRNINQQNIFDFVEKCNSDGFMNCDMFKHELVSHDIFKIGDIYRLPIMSASGNDFLEKYELVNFECCDNMIYLNFKSCVNTFEFLLSMTNLFNTQTSCGLFKSNMNHELVGSSIDLTGHYAYRKFLQAKNLSVDKFEIIDVDYDPIDGYSKFLLSNNTVVSISDTLDISNLIKEIDTSHNLSIQEHNKYKSTEYNFSTYDKYDFPSDDSSFVYPSNLTHFITEW